MRRALALLALLAFALGAASCGGDVDRAATTAADERTPFSYDASAPLLAGEREVANKGGVRTYDVSYESFGSGRVDAYFLEPSGDADLPPVVYLHGGGGSRNDLLAIAVGWVREGGRALLIEAAPVDEASTPMERLRAARRAEIETVIRVRRAVDYLNADSVGFVGWSAGARTGTIVAAVEPRIDAFVLMSGGATPLEQYVQAAPPSLRPQVRRLLTDIDPLHWAKRVRPNTIFFQNGRTDGVVPLDALRNLAAAAAKPQRVQWYDAAHALSKKAYQDQYAWLEQRLA